MMFVALLSSVLQQLTLMTCRTLQLILILAIFRPYARPHRLRTRAPLLACRLPKAPLRLRLLPHALSTVKPKPTSFR